ncbi:hypothetical protein MAPG_01475 [Magnaporthiopsis poae ATCC 64411]|uniref:SET domain-containing protein n=1 Tax=Magnaporthiopsis poae (strain ATCC 64411 / 73-15) TaxID=644358 RepID=A0A0C4DNT0_MAGP6|nr:hypothetical protein MAPG_01475 [Magnaporthiopsis poae ATCC 64411]
MWLALILFVASLASVALSSQSLDLAGTCPWSPQIQLWGRLATTPSQAACGKNESKNDSPTTSWDGPRACVGSYCVHSNAALGGIVLLTTEKNARRVMEVQPSKPGASDSGSLQETPFVERALPGKGLGLAAKRHIRRGELVMVEAPAMLVQKRVLEDRSGRYIESLDLAARSLPAARRKAFMRQGRAGDGEGGYQILDILLTNSFRLSLAGEGEAAGFHYGNYPNASRINHDCRPNLISRTDKSLVFRAYAARAITPGEELTISYIDQLAPVAERQAHTRAVWGFVCSCEHCRLPAAEASSSASRIKRLARLEEELGKFEKLDGRLDMAEELLRIYEVERLDSKLGGPYRLAALSYCMLGREDLARRYASLAAEALAMEQGEDTKDMEAIRALAQNPKGHPCWQIGG